MSLRAPAPRPKLPNDGSMLHYFQCRVCKTVMVVTVKIRDYERCNGCWSWMKHQFSVPVETDEQRAIAAKGKAWNPHRLPAPKCDVCGRNISEFMGDTVIPGVGEFCKDRATMNRFCTTEGLKRHETAMNRATDK